MTKKCTKCELEKPITSYYNARNHKDGLRSECKTCVLLIQKKNPNINAKSAKWRSKNKDKVFDLNLRIRYGINLNQYNAMLEIQNHKCAVCNLDTRKLKRKLYVDHCHISGKVRKLLCLQCNTALGMLKEDINTIENLKNYIKEYQHDHVEKVG